ncbi:MFS transporter [Nonomuraea sp. NPDC001636]|uniref:MFS transporter n=1 Tax=Nonomuraea sp. NPDC001636 TaxID=3154391 RepID=UPI0033311A54
MLERHWPAERIGLPTLVMLAAGAVAVALPLTAPWPTALVAANAFAVFAATAAMAWHSDRAGKAVPGEHRATALALFTLCYQLGGAFGPALAGLLLA